MPLLIPFLQLDALSAIQAKREIELGPRLGKSKTCVRQPAKALLDATQESKHKAAQQDDDALQMPDSDEEDELERAEKAVFGKAINTSKSELVDLDSSDSELVVEPAE